MNCLKSGVSTGIWLSSFYSCLLSLEAILKLLNHKPTKTIKALGMRQRFAADNQTTGLLKTASSAEGFRMHNYVVEHTNMNSLESVL